MAFVKYSMRSYPTAQDLFQLLEYLVSEEKYPIVLTPYPINHYAPLEYIALKWNYLHTYHHADQMTLCYHYVISFDLDHEYFQLRKIKPQRILAEIRTLFSFRGLDLFIAIHRSPNGCMEHVHIIVDSINARTGRKTFVDMKSLKEELGLFFSSFNIAFSGYSFMTCNHRLALGDEPPHRLYCPDLY